LPGPEADLSLLVGAAEDAGRIALRFWRQSPKAWDKGGEHGPVSEADLAADAALRVALCGARPEAGWLSEETPDTAERLQRQAVFIVDPIDGTRAFLAGEDGWAVSVALAVAGAGVAGVVHLPARGLTYAATATGPATRNGAPIAASARTALEGADVLTTRAALEPSEWPGGVPQVKRSFRTSLAWRLCLVAEGRHDAMLTLRPAWEWDIAAGALIAARAGCAVTDRQGAALRFNRADPRAGGVVAAPPALHGPLVAGLRG
jgi:myo-inositol-1(or 4)-monophosphatase